jgi:hypothetical protein
MTTKAMFWKNSNPPKRRFRKDEQKTKSGCSKHFSRAWVLYLGYESLKRNSHFLCSPNEDLGRRNKRWNPDFRLTFQWFISQIEYSRPWKVLPSKSGFHLLFLLPKSSFGRDNIQASGKTRIKKYITKFDNNKSNDFGISMHVIQLCLSFSLPLHGVSYPNHCFCCYRVFLSPPKRRRWKVGQTFQSSLGGSTLKCLSYLAKSSFGEHTFQVWCEYSRVGIWVLARKRIRKCCFGLPKSSRGGSIHF